MGTQLTARSVSLEWAARSSRFEDLPGTREGESTDLMAQEAKPTWMGIAGTLGGIDQVGGAVRDHRFWSN
jgi:hypothetical protein